MIEQLEALIEATELDMQDLAKQFTVSATQPEKEVYCTLRDIRDAARRLVCESEKLFKLLNIHKGQS